MAELGRNPPHIKLDERNHVEKPMLDQLWGLGWKVLDLDNKQHPSDSYRESFAQVVMLPVLREQVARINAGWSQTKLKTWLIQHCGPAAREPSRGLGSTE